MFFQPQRESNLFGLLLGKNIMKQKDGEKESGQSASVQLSNQTAPNLILHHRTAHNGIVASCLIGVTQKVEFLKCVLNLRCQQEFIVIEKNICPLKKISAEVWKCSNGHNTWKECWYHMTTPHSEVCVVVPQLSGGAGVENLTVSLQIFVYVFTLFILSKWMLNTAKNRKQHFGGCCVASATDTTLTT